MTRAPLPLIATEKEKKIVSKLCGRTDHTCESIVFCYNSSRCRATNQTWTIEQANAANKEAVDHPAHYGGENNPYEVIKVIYAWGLDKSFNLGNAIKYIARHEQKGAALEDLKKARWYLDEKIKQMEKLT